MSKLVALALVVLGLAIVVVYFLKSNQNVSLVPTSELTNKQQSESEFSIESLRKKEFRGSQIIVEKELATSGSFKSYIVSYQSEGLKINALISIPNSKKPEGGYPVVIVNHGYINPQIYSTENSYRKVSDFYATNGFLVLKPDFRGHANSESATTSRVLSRINYAIDVLNLIESIKTVSDANSSQIFMYGHSMGGEVTLRVLEVTSQVKAATLWAPAATTFPESFLYFIRKNRPELLGEIERDIANLFKMEDFTKVSSIENVHFIETPLVIHHGTADQSVPYQWSQELDKKLSQNNIDHTFNTYQGEDHNFTRGSWNQAVSYDLGLFQNISTNL